MSSVITCIINGSAGAQASGELKDRIDALFAARGEHPTIFVANRGDEIPELTRRALDQRSDMIVAVGGDGTVNCVASVVLDSDAVLGVLPAGTLNHFAKDLGIPTDLPGAVETLLTGRVGRVDIGEVNGKIFLNNSSLGLYPAIVRYREELQKKGHPKWSAFAAALVHALFRYQRLRAGLSGDEGSPAEEVTPFIFIGNNKYQVAGMRLGARDQLDGGELWVYRAPYASRGSLLKLAFRTLCGKQDQSELKMVCTKSLCVKTPKRHIHVARDGEVTKLRTPLRYNIRPKALSVMMPKES